MLLLLNLGLFLPGRDGVCSEPEEALIRHVDEGVARRRKPPVSLTSPPECEGPPGLMIDSTTSRAG